MIFHFDLGILDIGDDMDVWEALVLSVSMESVKTRAKLDESHNERIFWFIKNLIMKTQMVKQGFVPVKITIHLESECEQKIWDSILGCASLMEVADDSGVGEEKVFQFLSDLNNENKRLQERR